MASGWPRGFKTEAQRATGVVVDPAQELLAVAGDGHDERLAARAQGRREPPARWWILRRSSLQRQEMAMVSGWLQVLKAEA